MESVKEHLIVNEFAREQLKSSAKWGRFLAIVGFVGIANMILAVIVLNFVLPGLNADELQNTQQIQQVNPFQGTILSIFYILVSVLSFFPTFYLLKFSNYSIKALKENDEGMLQIAFKNLKYQYKFMGYLTIIMLVFVVIAMVGLEFGKTIGGL